MINGLLAIFIVSTLMNLAFIWVMFSQWLIDKTTHRARRAELCPWCHRSLDLHYQIRRT